MPVDPNNAGSGRFVNFHRILGLNAPSSRRQEDALASTIDAQGAAAKSAIESTRDQHLGAISSAGANAPTSFDFSDARKKLGTASSSLRATESAPGVQGLLQTQPFSGAGYTPAMSTMDTALMMGGGAQDRFGSLRDRYSGLAGLFDSARGAVDSASTAAHTPPPAAPVAPIANASGPRRPLDAPAPVTVGDGLGGTTTYRPVSDANAERLDRHFGARTTQNRENGPKGHGRKPKRAGAFGGLFDTF